MHFNSMLPNENKVTNSYRLKFKDLNIVTQISRHRLTCSSKMEKLLGIVSC